MSKRATAATLTLVAVLLAGSATVSNLANTAREFRRGFREGVRDANAGMSPAAMVAHAPRAGASRTAVRNFQEGYLKGRSEAARRAGHPLADPAVTASPAPQAPTVVSSQ